MLSSTPLVRSPMTMLALVVGAVFGLMLAETRLSLEHERRLRARGAVEPPADVYGVLAVLYPAAFLVMGLEGAWRLAARAPVVDLPGPSWFASGLVLFLGSKALKYWAIHALGDRWTFRVLVLPGAPLVSTGPYRYVSHPNYVAVVGELVGAAMMMGAIVSGPLMTVLFGVVLWLRIRVEREALAAAGRG